MLNLNDLLVFVQVVRHGGFTAASRALNVPKSTISKRVLELEKEAGVRLIHRTSRSFAVTELGQEFYRHAAAMLIEAEAAENVIKGRLAEPSGTVRVTASVPVTQRSLAPLLSEIASAYPKLRIVLEATDRFVDVVQEGFDIAIRSHLTPLSDSGLVHRTISTTEYWLVASPGYFDRVGRPFEPAGISGLDGLFASQGDNGWRLSNGQGVDCRVSLNPRYHANESVSLLEAAKAGLGIACLPSSFCTDLIRPGLLERVLPLWTAGVITTTLLMPHRRGQLPSVRAVADFLVDRLALRSC